MPAGSAASGRGSLLPRGTELSRGGGRRAGGVRTGRRGRRKMGGNKLHNKCQMRRNLNEAVTAQILQLPMS